MATGRLTVQERQSREPMEESPELRQLFHRLNNQLGIILAHADEEWIPLDEVERATRVLSRLAQDWMRGTVA